jgi:uncharacterized protein (DUF1330 family)
VPFERVVLLEFPDYERAIAFFRSSEYAEAKQYRIGAAKFCFCVIDGTAEKF